MGLYGGARMFYRTVMLNEQTASENPYQTPSTTASPTLPVSTGDCFREDRFLIVRERSELPQCCLKYGEEVPAGGWRKRKLIAWTPPWVLVGLLGGVLPLLLLILIAQKKAHITYSLGTAARKKMNRQRLIGWGLLLVCVALIVLAIQSGDRLVTPGLLVLGAIVSLIASLVIFVLVTPIRAVAHRNGWFKIKGASPDLLDRLPPVDFRNL